MFLIYPSLVFAVGFSLVFVVWLTNSFRFTTFALLLPSYVRHCQMSLLGFRVDIRGGVG